MRVLVAALTLSAVVGVAAQQLAGRLRIGVGELALDEHIGDQHQNG